MIKLFLLLLMTSLLFSCDHINNNIDENNIYEPVEKNITFYKQKHYEEVQLTALFNGNLVLRNNCLLIENQLGNLHLPIWPHDVSLFLVNGKLSIVRANKILLKLNQSVSLGGGQSSMDNELVKTFEVPIECSSYRFWIVSEIIDKD